jgi:hypothetical protein
MAKIKNTRYIRNIPYDQVSLNAYAYSDPVDPRRRPEYMDAQMIHEDPNAMANLPPNFIHKEFQPDRFMPNYWMESEIVPFGVKRMNEPEEII